MFSREFLSFGMALLLLSGGLFAQEQKPDPIEQLQWQRGPSTVAIGVKARLALPAGYRFLNAAETRKFMELTQNIPSEDEYVLAPENLEWWTAFTFADTGYVKDDEKLDPAELLTSIKEGTEAGNEERRKRGWETMSITGWRFEPRYDKSTQLLEWAISAVNDADKQPVINYNTRLLGRKGVMEVVLVADPAGLDKAVTELKSTLKGFSYIPGETYAEFREGDHVAEYGLAALVAGGAAAVITKKGLWPVIAAFFLKGWKLILLAVFGIGAFFKKRMGVGDSKK
jgi:uncharacterized membrane-anchored protein